MTSLKIKRYKLFLFIYLWPYDHGELSWICIVGKCIDVTRLENIPIRFIVYLMYHSCSTSFLVLGVYLISYTKNM